jgi:hypothetical protein
MSLETEEDFDRYIDVDAKHPIIDLSSLVI